MSKKLWFRAKTYGWGWTPCSWEGWLVILAYVLAVFFYMIRTLDAQLNGDYGAPLYYHLLIALTTLLLIWVCYKKGEKPGWRWGKK